ncbi:MAG: 4Fe-4S binding protein [Treponemataceae bacterium]
MKKSKTQDVHSKKVSRYRHYIQALGTLAINGNLKGFLQGKIFRGSSKIICLPVLNCYSCPGALTSCPIGSIQATISGEGFHLPKYVLGLTVLFAILAGRFFCGFLCPFGFFQDLLFKIPVKKAPVIKKLARIFSYLRYVILAVFVFLLPFALKDKFGFSNPYFCKYLCPAGTLFAALPLMAMSETLRAAAGILFANKIAISIFITLLSITLYRPFCRFLCPLGALLGIFNPISFYGLKVDKTKCVNCRICEKTCKFNIPTYKKPNSPDCIRCNDCLHACPFGAIQHKFPLQKDENEMIT